MTKSSDPLSNLEFKEGGAGGDFIKFVAGKPIKIRVFTVNPTIHINNYGKEQISFAVWNWDEDKAMILSKGASIAKQISAIHRDEDFGADITKIDIKITPTGEGMEREYAINPLPKPMDLNDGQEEALAELDKKLDTIFKGSVRAADYNAGKKPAKPDFNPERDIERIEGEPINLDSIPF